jgi:hypothetical protein
VLPWIEADKLMAVASRDRVLVIDGRLSSRRLTSSTSPT